MPAADKCHLLIPYKEWAKDLADALEGVEGVNAQILAKMGEEEFQNYKKIEDRVNDRGCTPVGGTGRPYATYVVAAPNSQHPDAANADFQGDYTAIQAAIDALDPILGGMILLLDGEFEYGSSDFVSTGNDNVAIAGMGAATQLVGSSAGVAFEFDTCYRPSVRDLAINGTWDVGVQLISCESPMLHGMWIGDTGGGIGDQGVLSITGDHLSITGCKFYGCDYGIATINENHFVIEGNGMEEIVTVGVDVVEANPVNGIINGNAIRAAVTGINVQANTDDLSITSNLLQDHTNGVAVAAGCDRILVANNTMRNVTNHFTGAGTANKGAGNYLDGTWTT